MRKKDNTDYYIHRHSCFLLQYHIVFVTKFRHPVLVNGVRDAVYERIRYVADQEAFIYWRSMENQTMFISCWKQIL